MTLENGDLTASQITNAMIDCFEKRPGLICKSNITKPSAGAFRRLLNFWKDPAFAIIRVSFVHLQKWIVIWIVLQPRKLIKLAGTNLISYITLCIMLHFRISVCVIKFYRVKWIDIHMAVRSFFQTQLFLVHECYMCLHGVRQRFTYM